jgi:hypothetical protein
VTAQATAPRNFVAASSPRDRRFYPAMALVLAIVVAAGFTPTFFARGRIEGAAPLPLSVLLHGVFGTAWVVLFAVQTVLVAAQRVSWHRRVGWVAAVVSGAFVASGALVTAALERSHGAEPAAWRAAHWFTNGAPLCAFALLVVAGLWQRSTPARHKRFMLLAAVVLLPPAIGRLFGYLDVSELDLAAYASFAFAGAAYDWLVYGRPHAVSLLGAIALVAMDLTTTAWLAAVGS